MSGKDIEVKQDSPLKGFEPSDLPMSPAAAKEMMEQYQQLMAAILVPWDQRVFKDGKLIKDSDYQRFSTQVVNPQGQKVTVFVDRVKKSGARKLAMATKISVDIVSHTREERTDGSFVYRYEVKATTLTGRSMPGVGKADSRAMHTPGREEHDAEATAQTRATNRAILDLIGFGQVSAEEMEDGPLNAKVIQTEAKIKDEGHLEKGATVTAEQNGNHTDPVSFWLAILRENGLTEEEIGYLDMRDLGSYKMNIEPNTFLGDGYNGLWGRMNNIVRAQRGDWVRGAGEKGKGAWTVPY